MKIIAKGGWKDNSQVYVCELTNTEILEIFRTHNRGIMALNVGDELSLSDVVRGNFALQVIVSCLESDAKNLTSTIERIRDALPR